MQLSCLQALFVYLITRSLQRRACAGVSACRVCSASWPVNVHPKGRTQVLHALDATAWWRVAAAWQYVFGVGCVSVRVRHSWWRCTINKM